MVLQRPVGLTNSYSPTLEDWRLAFEILNVGFDESRSMCSQVGNSLFDSYLSKVTWP